MQTRTIGKNITRDEEGLLEQELRRRQDDDVYRFSEEEAEQFVVKNMMRFLEELNKKGLPKGYIDYGKIIWADLATKYRIDGKRRKLFNGAKYRLLDRLQDGRKKAPEWIRKDPEKLKTYQAVKRMFIEAEVERQRRLAEGIDDEIGSEELEVEEEEDEPCYAIDSDEPDTPPRTALKRRAERFGEEALEDEEGIVAEVKSYIERRQARSSNKRLLLDVETNRPTNLTDSVKPVAQCQVQSSRKEAAARTAPEGNMGGRLSGTPRCTASSTISLTSSASDLSATLAKMDEEQHRIIQDMEREFSVLEQELKQRRKDKWVDKAVGTGDSPIEDQREIYEQRREEDQKRIKELEAKVKLLEEEKEKQGETIEENYERMREEDQKRIKELENNVRRQSMAAEEARGQAACAWTFVYEYRTKWDGLVDALRNKDLVEVEKKFLETFTGK